MEVYLPETRANANRDDDERQVVRGFGDTYNFIFGGVDNNGEFGMLKKLNSNVPEGMVLLKKTDERAGVAEHLQEYYVWTDKDREFGLQLPDAKEE